MEKVNMDSIGLQTNQQKSEMTLNRAQRRAKAKQQRKIMKQIQKYIKEHPEAIKYELNEEALAEAEEREKLLMEISEEKLSNQTSDR